MKYLFPLLLVLAHLLAQESYEDWSCLPAIAEEDGTGGIILDAYWLYLRPSETGLPLGIVRTDPEQSNQLLHPLQFNGQVTDEEPTHVTLEKCHEPRPHFRFSSGIKLGIGWTFPCLLWQLKFDWTHLNSTANRQFRLLATDECPTPSVFFPDWGTTSLIKLAEGTGTLTPNPDFVKGSWRLRFDLYDLDLAKSYHLTPTFSLKPHLGIRAADLNRRFRIRQERAEENPWALSTRLDADWTRVGPRAALEAWLHAGCGLSFYGQGGTSILFGTTDYTFKEGAQRLTDCPRPLFLTRCHASSRENQWLHDFAFGFRWRKGLNCDEYFLTVNVSWENFIFPHQYRFDNAQGKIRNDDLTFTGTIPLGAQNHVTDRRYTTLWLQGLRVGASLEF